MSMCARVCVFVRVCAYARECISQVRNAESSYSLLIHFQMSTQNIQLLEIQILHMLSHPVKHLSSKLFRKAHQVQVAS